MPAKKQYVVRVVQTEDYEGGKIDGAFLESLRYAQLITVHETDPNGLTVNCFDLHAPHGLDSKTWAEGNAARMKTFGFNAVAAPSTR